MPAKDTPHCRWCIHRRRCLPHRAAHHTVQLDNDYAASGYARDMEQEAIYAQARARLAREEKP